MPTPAPSRLALLSPLLLLACAACTARQTSAAEPDTSTGDEAPLFDDQAMAPPKTPVAETQTDTAHAADTPTPDKLPQPPPALPPAVDAGTIDREALTGVLEQGVGRFLQRVQLQRHPSEGRFEGWLLHGLFEREPAWRQACPLRPGDVVLRINNHSVERPEQFLAVWQSLSTAGELNIDVVRGGQPSRVRYIIAD